MVEGQQEEDIGSKINAADYSQLLEGQLSKMYLLIGGDRDYKNHFAINFTLCKYVQTTMWFQYEYAVTFSGIHKWPKKQKNAGNNSLAFIDVSVYTEPPLRGFLYFL